MKEAPGAGIARGAPPVIILLAPQLGENIGAAARAMRNFGLSELRLVNPRDGWPNAQARSMASGAGEILERARLFRTSAEAVADISLLIASSARRRDMVKPVLTPDEAARRCREASREGARAGILFGGERAGLTNEDVTRAQALLRIGTAPDFPSLNLGQAVLLFAWSWWNVRPDNVTKGERDTEGETLPMGASFAARRGAVEDMLAHLEAELTQAGFFHPPEKTPSMRRNVRNIFTRMPLADQEVRTLRGVIRALSSQGRRNAGGRKE